MKITMYMYNIYPVFNVLFIIRKPRRCKENKNHVFVVYNSI